jgi:glycosyltransferase involved in cell wall biosynthesis
MQPVCVVMPAHNEQNHIEGSIASIQNIVDWIIVIDDGSNDRTGELARNALADTGQVIRTEGLGVGGAIAIGSQAVLQLDNRDWITVVMAGDGQMDPADIPVVIEPILKGRADHVKGNRFIHHLGPNGMPFIRRLGTWWLSRLTSLASGRKLRDTQCGYTATSRAMNEAWDWSDTWTGYGYPNWWLMEASRRDFRIEEVPVRSVYGNEKSGIRLIPFFLSVSWMLWKGIWRRGLDWYILGSKSPIGLRILASSLWFGAWSSLILAFNWPILSLAAIPSFLLLMRLDQYESNRRTLRGWCA